MTPKELMPRGRKTNQELARMRQKMKNVVKFIITAEERMTRAEDRLKKKHISPHVRASLQDKVQKERTQIINKIIGLNLNLEKIKRLTNKIKSIALKLREAEAEILRYERRFKMSYQELQQLYNQVKVREDHPGGFQESRRATRPWRSNRPWSIWRTS